MLMQSNRCGAPETRLVKYGLTTPVSARFGMQGTLLWGGLQLPRQKSANIIVFLGDNVLSFGVS